jgi:HEPN domain-containing protein
MRDLETARIMLHSAGRDLQAIGNMRRPEAFPVEVFGFHAQQVVEKSLKAWLSLKAIQYKKTHNIRLLIALLEQAGEDVSKLSEFENLNGFAVQFRYAAFEMADEQLDRDTVVQRAADLHHLVMKLLKSAEALDNP